MPNVEGTMKSVQMSQNLRGLLRGTGKTGARIGITRHIIIDIEIGREEGTEEFVVGNIGLRMQ
jgi:hypothetical protein